ncbi:MAG: hypothetical protein CM1200mP39_15720 [Dehalococcoidia bacterium]|nr:MAG: hypothetical protein CM1200mP39_15720 [Dehalococcoidia bacterium]
MATYECNRLFDAQNIYEVVKGQSSLAFVILMALLLVNMFAFGSFTHRPSRNLLTLKSSEQGFTPEKAVMWFFIPIINPCLSLGRCFGVIQRERPGSNNVG